MTGAESLSVTNCIGAGPYDNCGGSEFRGERMDIIVKGEESSINISESMINRCLLIILVIGLIVGAYLIYHRHKGKKGLWKNILKWDLYFFFIIADIRFIAMTIMWYIGR